ncbi:hypothetical protein WICPIJ_005038 [Wickerhamomyces pijperi]|uniref:Peptidase M20 dimerisation domain-containing protein n=1 Tax=Wickerhamomyces pijperi TaxID=599730 RepID=A0A9P8Q6H8_WICPI|nr:hypothetical protein WICPIJ_005038 [Wickerhamomyces pijperi]
MPITLDPPSRSQSSRPLKFLSYSALITTFVTLFLYVSSNLETLTNSTTNTAIPPNPYTNVVKLRPSGSRSHELLTDPEYREKSIRYLSGAVQIPTEVFDDSIAPEKDLSQWTHFLELHKYLESTFPLVFNTLKVEKINKLGLIITYEGTNPDLLPLIFTGHQDVVPVDGDTLDRWEHGPFSGYYDGKFMYGRGTSDTKSLVIGHFEVWQLLLEKGYKPKRTMVLSLGYDEETIGRYDGALSLVSVLKKRYSNGIYALIDEGSGVNKLHVEDQSVNRYLAMPGTVEKGYMDVFFELYVKGGHSSSPYDHSGIGILSELVRSIELDPYEYSLTAENPVLDYLCYLGDVDGLVMEGIDNVDKLKWSFRNARYNQEAHDLTLEYLSKHPSLRNLIRTTQAIDMFHAGLKINVIPEYLKLGINHRLSLDWTTEDIIERLVTKAKKIAEQFDLNLYLNNGTVISENALVSNHLNVSWEQPLNSSPISPSNDRTWSVLAGAIKSTFEDSLLPENSTVDVVPFLVGGYTDSSRYYALGNNIYRFTGHTKEFRSMHAINEMIEFDGHLETVGFFYDYVLAVNEFDSE